MGDLAQLWPAPGPEAKPAKQLEPATVALGMLDIALDDPHPPKKSARHVGGIKVRGPAVPPPTAMDALVVDVPVDVGDVNTDDDDLASDIALCPGADEISHAPAVEAKSKQPGNVEQLAGSSKSKDPRDSDVAEPGGPDCGKAPAVPRAEDWGPFKVARVFSRGVPIGWGATCGRHTNVGDANCCKKQIQYGAKDPLTDEQCVAKLKRWLISGFDIPTEGLASRKEHLNIEIRRLAAETKTADELWRELEVRLGREPAP
jgi:hypothetical protein